MFARTALAIALASSAPVTIGHCALITERAPSGARTTVQQMLRISYTIQSRTPADEMDFRLAPQQRPGDALEFHARGFFSDGVLIADRLVRYAGPGRPELNGPAACAATYVHFTDGTSWTPPAVPAR